MSKILEKTAGAFISLILGVSVGNAATTKLIEENPLKQEFDAVAVAWYNENAQEKSAKEKAYYCIEEIEEMTGIKASADVLEDFAGKFEKAGGENMSDAEALAFVFAWLEDYTRG